MSDLPIKLDVPVLNFKPIKMYVFNGDDNAKLVYVIGSYNNYYLGVPIDTVITLKTEFVVTPYRFAMPESEVIEKAKSNSLIK